MRLSYIISDNIDADHWIIYFYIAHAIIPKTRFFLPDPPLRFDILIRIKEGSLTNVL